MSQGGRDNSNPGHVAREYDDSLDEIPGIVCLLSQQRLLRDSREDSLSRKAANWFSRPAYALQRGAQDRAQQGPIKEKKRFM